MSHVLGVQVPGRGSGGDARHSGSALRTPLERVGNRRRTVPEPAGVRDA